MEEMLLKYIKEKKFSQFYKYLHFLTLPLQSFCLSKSLLKSKFNLSNIYSESFESNEHNVTLTDKAKDGLVLCVLSSILKTWVLWVVFYGRTQYLGLQPDSLSRGRILYSNKFKLKSVRIAFPSFLPTVTGHGLLFFFNKILGNDFKFTEKLQS